MAIGKIFFKGNEPVIAFFKFLQQLFIGGKGEVF